MIDPAPGYSLVSKALSRHFDTYRNLFDGGFPDIGGLVAPSEVCALLDESLDFILLESLRQGAKKVRVACGIMDGEFLTVSVKIDVPQFEISSPLRLRELEGWTIHLDGVFGSGRRNKSSYFVITVPINY